MTSETRDLMKQYLRAVADGAREILEAMEVERAEPVDRPGDDLLTPTEVARMCGKDASWLYSQNLPFRMRLSHRCTRYRRADVERWLEERKASREGF